MSICKIRLHNTFCVNFTAGVIKGVPITNFVIGIFEYVMIPKIIAICVFYAVVYGIAILWKLFQRFLDKDEDENKTLKNK